MSEHVPLRAGPLTICFDPSEGQLRWIRYGRSEVLRGIYGAVRDRDWGTASPRIENLVMDRRDDALDVRFLAICQRDGIDFRWRGTITGTSDTEVRYRFEGEAHSSFERNRIGLCVLHPIRECAGRPCRITHPDGSEEVSTFPDLIAAEQPFLQVAVMRHNVAPGVDVEVRFLGEVFETEDQRNWTDASFKTYGTPLELPFPVRVEKGNKVVQEVIVRLLGAASRVESVLPDLHVLTAGAKLTLPRLGFLHGGTNSRLDDVAAGRLASLRPAHLRVELHIDKAKVLDDLNTAADDAARLGAELQAVLILEGEPDERLDRVLEDAACLPVTVAEWIVLPSGERVTPDAWLRRLRTKLAEFFIESRIGGGTNAHFAEVNCERLTRGIADVLSYSVNPQVHAFDDATLVENLAGQCETVRSARAFAGGAKIHVGPITLRARATHADTSVPLDELPSDADPRQVSVFLAAWTLGSIVALARENAESATYFELSGCRGILGDPRQERLPGPFGALAAGVYPVFHLFADLAELSAHKWRELVDGTPDTLTGIIADDSKHVMALLANLTDRPRECELPFEPTRIRALDAESYALATAAPEAFRATWQTSSSRRLTLAPQAYVRVEGRRDA
ncbi:MAG: hypothetical protein SGJ19_01335 [Planctomycetia bacterium]|nr:hypothetical protein [Planctomycetia bacterium]